MADYIDKYIIHLLILYILIIIIAFSVLQIVTCNPHKDPHFVDGRAVMVHLFEWKWNDIAFECERYLGPNGYGGVQLSPVTENVIIANRPWYERYQPISYKFETRSGNEKELHDMIQRCNKVGVRIYVDAIINHMARVNEQNIGTGGSTADPQKFLFPGCSFGPNDFNRPSCGIDNYNDRDQVRNCELDRLPDLNHGTVHVRQQIIDMMNQLIDMGVAGFRIDAAKHMWPENLKIIYNSLKALNTEHGFPAGARPYIVQEVIDKGGESISKYEYSVMAAVTEFKACDEIANILRRHKPLKHTHNWGHEWGLLPSGDALVFVDNHDNQRGHGGAGTVLTYKESYHYKMAVAFFLAHPYGITRIMSSYDFNDKDQGPPQDAAGNLLSPTIKSDGTCGDGWICEHRWRQIANMAQFRRIVGHAKLVWLWDNGGNQIMMARDGRGFIAFNNEHGKDLVHHIQTTLPAGTYCDIISGNKKGNKCTGHKIAVAKDGSATINIKHDDPNGFLAFHVDAKITK